MLTRFSSFYVCTNPNVAQYKKDLEEKDLKLSPHGIMNDKLIIERLEQDWRLENWK